MMYLSASAFTRWRYAINSTPCSYCKHFKYCSNLRTCLLLQMFLLTFTCARGGEGLQYNDLQTLDRNLPGCYSKIHQSYKHDQTAIPIHKVHFLFGSEIYKLATPMFNDSVTFYFQDFSKSTTKPVRSGFYSFSTEGHSGGVRMRSFLINGSVLVSGVCRTGEHVALSRGVMKRLASKSRAFGECDMLWKRMGDGRFVGITGPLCLGSIGQNQGRIPVSMTLSNDQLVMTEGWYRISSKLLLKEFQISYVLQKSLRPDIYQHGRHKSHDSDLELKTNEVLPPFDIPNYFISKALFKNKTVNSSQPNINKIHRRGNQLTMKREWKRENASRKRNLKKFPQILLALTSGFEVHFLIDLRMCSNVGNVSRARSLFAGRVKNFVYVRQDDGNYLEHGYIRFMTRKNGVGSLGAQMIVRYVTLFSDGRVKVQMYKTYPDRPFSSMILTDSVQCQLRQGRVPYGGAVFTRNPRDRVSVVQNFKALTRSVAQGVSLNLVVDLSRCQGTDNTSRHVIGSQVTDFDLTDSGQTVELSTQSLLPDTLVDLAHPATFVHGILGRVHMNGDVNITFISNSQSQYRDKKIVSTYRCQLYNVKTRFRQVDNDKSVTMFRKN